MERGRGRQVEGEVLGFESGIESESDVGFELVVGFNVMGVKGSLGAMSYQHGQQRNGKW
jgi:hypothetical protein